jgi:hypothetical protein
LHTGRIFQGERPQLDRERGDLFWQQIRTSSLKLFSP